MTRLAVNRATLLTAAAAAAAAVAAGAVGGEKSVLNDDYGDDLGSRGTAEVVVTGAVNRCVEA